MNLKKLNTRCWYKVFEWLEHICLGWLLGSADKEWRFLLFVVLLASPWKRQACIMKEATPKYLTTWRQSCRSKFSCMSFSHMLIFFANIKIREIFCSGVFLETFNKTVVTAPITFYCSINFLSQYMAPMYHRSHNWYMLPFVWGAT